MQQTSIIKAHFIKEPLKNGCFVFCGSQITVRDPFTALGRKKKQRATSETTTQQPKALLETLSLFGKKISWV